MNYGTIEATFAYQDVQWVDPDFEDDGSWTVDVNDMEAIMDLLHKKRIRAPVCSIKPYADSLVGEPVATSKEGQRACTVCDMDVQLKKMFQHMAYHIGRGEIPVAAAPPCGFCGNTDGRCHLVMNKVKTAKAHFQPTAASCAHGCFVKHNIASLCKPVVHNEPIKCPVPGCPDCVFRYNMEQHMKVDEDHSNFEASPSEQEVWRLCPAEQCALEVGETANNATQKVARAAKRQKDAKTSKKLRGESKLQREAVAKVDQAEEDVCRQQALCLGDQDAEQAMATQDMADLDYDPPSGSEASNSDEEKVGSSSDASDASDSDSSNSSSSTSSSSSSSSSSSAAAGNVGTAKKIAPQRRPTRLNVSLPLSIKLERRQRPCNLEGIPTEVL